MFTNKSYQQLLPVVNARPAFPSKQAIDVLSGVPFPVDRVGDSADEADDPGNQAHYDNHPHDAILTMRV